MAENSPSKRGRFSPRKHPYERATGLGPAGHGFGVQRSPLKDTNFNPNVQHSQNLTTQRLLKPLALSLSYNVENENQNPTQNIKRIAPSAAPKIGFIPVEKSCVIGGNEIHSSATTTTTNVSGLDKRSGLPSVPSCSSVTTGVLGALQPRGLNSSFTEKFESRLGLHSDSQKTQAQESHPIVKRGILTERFIPLFDFPEYSTDILKYWGRMERRFRIEQDYMLRHRDISHKMRTILVDWIAEVILEYDMTEETLHLAVNYIDRFLTRMDVERTKLQLVGATALFVASKFEEIHPPETADYVFLTDDAYSKEQILGMENLMLTVLEFDLMMPTAHSFALAYCSILRLGDPIRCLAMYLVDLSLMEGETYLHYVPSVIASAAVVLGRYTFENVYWDDKIQGICTHRRKTVAPCIRDLHSSFFAAPMRPNTAIYEKYKTVRYCQISLAFIPGYGPWMETNYL